MAAIYARSFLFLKFPLSIHLLHFHSFTGKTSLCKCAPVTSSLLATVMSNWEVCRDKTVTQSSELFHDTQYIMQAMVDVSHARCLIRCVTSCICLICCVTSCLIIQANWLPVPLSRVGGVLHLLSPKEIYAVTNTMWKVLKVIIRNI